MAWIEHGLQISLKRHALSMEDKMAAGIWARYELWVRGQSNNSEKVHHQLPRTRTRLTHSFSTPAGQIFFIVEDLKNYSQMKVDSTGRAILAVLRNCGRLRESRGGGLVRYVIQV